MNKTPFNIDSSQFSSEFDTPSRASSNVLGVWGRENKLQSNATETAPGEMPSSSNSAQGSNPVGTDTNSLFVMLGAGSIGRQAGTKVSPRKGLNLGTPDKSQDLKTPKPANLRWGSRYKDNTRVKATPATVPVSVEPPQLPLLVPESPLRLSFDSD